MREEPLYLYTAIMAGYARLGRFKDAFSVLGVLRQRRIRPNSATFSILQRCCLGRLDAAGDVRQLLRIMEQMGVAPDGPLGGFRPGFPTVFSWFSVGLGRSRLPPDS